MKLVIFIDYDNLLERHKSSGILDVATTALLQTSLSPMSLRGTCHIRIYGGWYEGPTMTQRAQDLAVAIAKDFPAIIRLPCEGNKILSLATNAELAVAMMEEPDHLLFGTYRKKGKPGNLRVQTPTAVGCTDSACSLKVAKKLLKTGKCPVAGCLVMDDDLVYRHEQKIVDTMLTCDMIYAPTQDYQHLILVSGDDDFLPPVRTALLRGTPVARFHPKPNRTRSLQGIRGAKLTEKDL
ncbi:MAG: NYN domain-containing protein [Verrucomicrobia bacterium]|nr:NYN domain-containing protein [Verrucomicrobiota bacterium]MCH8511873.1 NYN domain-containing protein [Kiritimatiellia bacterium]